MKEEEEALRVKQEDVTVKEECKKEEEMTVTVKEKEDVFVVKEEADNTVTLEEEKTGDLVNTSK